MPPFRRAFCALTLLWLSSTAVAAAHAYVVGAQPPANSGNERSQGWVSISFDEPIDLIDADALQVFAPDGKRIDARDVKIDPADATRVVVHIPRSLRRGVYTVRWRVISADSHVVHGSYQVGIGVPVSGTAGGETASPYDPASPPAAFLRWLTLMGALLATGAIFMRLYALDRLEAAYPGVVELARRCTIAGAVVVLAAWAPTVIVQSAAASGVLGSGIAGTLARTPWGIALIARAVAAAALLLLAARGWKTAGRGAIAIAAALLATFSVTGHAFAQPGGLARALAVAIDFAHLCCAAVWIGGLFVLAALLAPWFRAKGDARERARALFAAFTPAAILCVGTIVATGIYASAVHVDAPADLFVTAYGRLLLAKAAILVVLVAFGWHHSRVGAGIRSNAHNATIAYEAIWGIAVVALTAVLVGQAPPANDVAVPTSPAAALLLLLCGGIVARFLFVAKTGARGSNARTAPVYFDVALVAAGMLFLCIGVVGRLVTITSVSMYPTLALGDVVFVDRVTYGLRAPRDGEILVLRPPVRRVRDEAQRVIGVGGDAVEIANGVVYRNGAVLREPYATGPIAYDLRIKDYEIYVNGVPLDPSLANVPPRAMWQSPSRIPRGFYLVLGDNRNYAVDSHYWGFAQTGGAFAAGLLRAQRVPVPGRPLFITWPASRAGGLEAS